MKKFFSLMVLLLTGVLAINARGQADDDFLSTLNQVKNPFVIDLPKPSAPPPNMEVKEPKATQPQKPKPMPVLERIVLPDLTLQGVIVSPDLHQAIINNQMVGLQQKIQGAKVITITPEGVGLLFKGKKFFLKREAVVSSEVA